MFKKKFWPILFVFILLVGGVSWWRAQKPPSLKPTQETVKVEPSQTEVINPITLVLDFREDKISTYSASINPNDKPTAFSVISQISQENQLELVSKTSDFGVLIESIKGVKNGPDRFWIYYVNGQMAQVAADKYELKSGDLIQWKYEKNPF